MAITLVQFWQQESDTHKAAQAGGAERSDRRAALARGGQGEARHRRRRAQQARDGDRDEPRQARHDLRPVRAHGAQQRHSRSDRSSSARCRAGSWTIRTAVAVVAGRRGCCGGRARARDRALAGRGRQARHGHRREHAAPGNQDATHARAVRHAPGRRRVRTPHWRRTRKRRSTRTCPPRCRRSAASATPRAPRATRSSRNRSATRKTHSARRSRPPEASTEMRQRSRSPSTTPSAHCATMGPPPSCATTAPSPCSRI